MQMAVLTHLIVKHQVQLVQMVLANAQLPTTTMALSVLIVSYYILQMHERNQKVLSEGVQRFF